LNLFEFKYPFNIIYSILAVASFILLILGYKKKERILNLLKISAARRYKILRTVLAALGLCLIVFSMLGPQSFIGVAKVNREG
jgi:Ca-activated chloride channel family protein